MKKVAIGLACFSLVIALMVVCCEPASASSDVTVSTTETWGPENNPYELSSLTITSSGTLNISAGCLLVFDSEESCVVVYGHLNVNGTEGSPVAFTGTQWSPGAWGGIIVESSGELDCDHAAILCAGSSETWCSLLVEGGRATLEGCLISNSDLDGIEVFDGSLTMTATTITDYGFDGVWYESSDDLNLSDVTIYGNGSDYGLLIDGYEEASVDVSDSQFIGCGTAVLFYDVVSLAISDTTASGCTRWAIVGYGGSAVNLTGLTVTESLGWGGVYCHDIEDLCLAGCDLDEVEDYAVFAYDSGLTITGCTITDAGESVVIDADTALTVTIDDTTICSGGCVEIGAYDSEFGIVLVGRDNSIPATNLCGAIEWDSALPSGEDFGTTYGLHGLDYIYGYPHATLLTINEGASLTIAGGSTLAAKDGETGAAIRVFGTLETEATSSSNRVYLTSEDESAGGWAGIWVEDGGTVDLDWAEISYAGQTADFGGVSRAGSLVVNGGEATLTHCLVSDSAEDGVQVADGELAMTWSRVADNECGVRVLGGQASMSYCQVWTNDLGLYVDLPGTQPSVHYNSLVDNASYAIWNERANTTVVATSNWWGDPAGCPLDNPNSAYIRGETVDVDLPLDHDPTPVPLPPPAHQWYSQIDPEATGGEWDDTNLDILYYPNYNPNISFLDKMQGGGCCICSWAMVLKNMDQTSVYSRKDIRSGLTEIQTPDPFTVTLANTREWDIDYDEQSGHYEAEYADSPVLTYHGRVAGEFGVTAGRMKFAYASLTADLDITTAGEEAEFSATIGGDSIPFPSEDFYVTIEDEAILVASSEVVGNTVTFTGLTRGQLDTTAADHNAPAGVFEGTEEGKALVISEQLQTHDWGVIAQLAGAHWAVMSSSSLDPDDPDDFPDKEDERIVGEEKVFVSYDITPPGPLEEEREQGKQEEVWLESLRSTTLVPTVYDKGLQICDPGTDDPDKGDKVAFEDSWSFERGRDLGHITCIVLVELP